MLAITRSRLVTKSGLRPMPAGRWFNAVRLGQRTGEILNEVVVVDPYTSHCVRYVGVLGLRGGEGLV